MNLFFFVLIFSLRHIYSDFYVGIILLSNTEKRNIEIFLKSGHKTNTGNDYKWLNSVDSEIRLALCSSSVALNWNVEG